MSTSQEKTAQATKNGTRAAGQQQYRLLLDHVRQIIFQTDPDGRWTFLNPAWEEITGHPCARSLGTRFHEYIYPDDQEKSAALFQSLIAGAEDAIQTQVRLLMNDGGFCWVDVFAKAVHAENGALLGIVGSLTDITEPKQIDEELRMYQETLEEMVDMRTADLNTANEQLRREITERKKQEKLKQLRYEITRALSEARTEEEALQAIVENAKADSKVAVSIALLEERQGERVNVIRAQNAFESGLKMMPEGTPLRPDRFPLSRLLSRETPFVSGDLANDENLSGLRKETIVALGVGSMAVLPIATSDQWLGNLALLAAEKDYFEDEWLDFYQTLVEQAATTLWAIRLHHEAQQSLERRTREVRLSTRIAQEIATTTELNELYERVVTEVKEQFGYYYAQLLRYDPVTDVVALVAGYGEIGKQMLREKHELRRGEGIIGRAAATGRPVLRPIVQDDLEWRSNPLLPDTAGELAVPIMLKEEVLGVLDVQSARPGQLSAEDQIVLEGLCGQIATAIESTRLQQEMEARLEELNTLQRLTTREAWLNYQANRRSQAPGYLFDQQAIQPLSVDGANGNGQSPQAGPVPVPEEREKTASLTIRGQVIGTLGVQEDPTSPLSQDEEELLESISRQVAEALENARLLDQTQKRAVELETVARVSATTSTILESEKLLKAVVELTKRSFNLYHAHIYLLDEASGNLILAAGSGEAGDMMVEEGWHISLRHEHSLVARSARQREAIIVDDVRQEAGYLANPMLPATRSEMAVPMIATNKLLGVLDIQAETASAFTEEDARIHTTLGTQVAIALQNASLYEEQLETAKQLREIDRLKTEFLASMSHELRTPLNSIIGFADVLLEGLDGELSARMEEDVRLIRNSGQHLRELIGDILDMSKIEAGMMELRYELFDVPSMAQDIEAFAKTQLMTHDKTFDFELNVGTNVDTIYADRTRLKQVLYNLVSNAIKFTTEGRVTATMQMTDDEMLLVEVTDTGIGIEPENVSIIFEQFRQVDGSLTRTVGGTGLGLPISRSLVELHGGEIGVESSPGDGSTFWFTIPKEQPV